MGYKILYDKRLIELSDGRYIFMLQTGDSDKVEKINGRILPQKHWEALKDEKSQKTFFTMGELQYVIFRNILDSINEDGSVSVAYTKKQFFETPNDLRRFFTTGLKNAITIAQLEEARNNLYIGRLNERGYDNVRTYIEGEEELLKTFESMRNEYGNDVYIGFTNRNLNALHIKGRYKDFYKQVSQWYVIFGNLQDGETGTKVYFRRRSNRRLFVTEEVSEAKAFGTREKAQKCLEGFPELQDDIAFQIEERTDEIMLKHRVYVKNQKEMEQE